SISNRSLITGNVSTDESRKEIRKSPGAPRTPAKATLFCFHALNGLVKRKPPGKVLNSQTLSRALEQRLDRFNDYIVNVVQLLRLDQVWRKDVHKTTHRPGPAAPPRD